MNSFENKSGNFINSIVDNTIVLESVIEELDSYDLDDDSVMESVIDMVMEGNPNNRQDATRAGVLHAKINEKVLRSRGNDKKVERLYKIQNNITDKYDKDLPTPNGYKHNFYRNAMNGTFRKYKDRDDELNNVNVRKDTNDIVKRNRSKYYDPYNVKPKKKANEDVDGYDEFDDTDNTVLESVIEELDSYDLDDDSVMESVFNMVMEGNPNNRQDATRAGVLAAKIEAKMGDVAGKMFSSDGNDRVRYDNRYERLKSRRDAIENKYSRKLTDPRGGKRNYYSDSHGYQVHYGPYDGHENVRKCAKKIMDCGKNVPNRKSPYDPYKVKPKKKANEDVDGYDEFDRLVDEAIEEAEYCEAMEGLKDIIEKTEHTADVVSRTVKNPVIASVDKFMNYGMNETEAKKAMNILMVFIIRNDMATRKLTQNDTSIKNNDLKVYHKDFIVDCLHKWFRTTSKHETSSRFKQFLESSYAKFESKSNRQEDYDNAINIAKAGRTDIRVNNKIRRGRLFESVEFNEYADYSEASVFESVDESDIVLEALFEKRTLDTVLQSYLKQLEKKLVTVEACDKFLALIKQDQAKFNNALKVCADAKIKLDKDQIDEKQFKNLTKSAAKQIAGYCKTFKLKMSDFGGGGLSASQNITKEDIANFKQYVTGLISGVRSIKKKRQAIVKEMNRKIGQKSTLNKDISSANEATFDEIFITSDIDD